MNFYNSDRYTFRSAIYSDVSGSTSVTLEALKLYTDVNVIFKWVGYHVQMTITSYSSYQIIFDIDGRMHTGIAYWNADAGNLSISAGDIYIVVISPISLVSL